MRQVLARQLSRRSPGAGRAIGRRVHAGSSAPCLRVRNETRAEANLGPRGRYGVRKTGLPLLGLAPALFHVDVAVFVDLELLLAERRRRFLGASDLPLADGDLARHDRLLGDVDVLAPDRHANLLGAGAQVPRDDLARAGPALDDDLLVLNKPKGLVVHPAAGHETGTLVNALIAHCGTSLSGIGGVKRPGIVHRLDKDTTGLMVVAKNDRAHQSLTAQFADHGRTGALRRGYMAFVWGAPSRSHGTIDQPIDRHPFAREKMAVRQGGRHAVTHWEMLESFEGRDGKPLAALLACQLETGRTHQIRVHLGHVGHPLIGDDVYGSGFRTKANQLGTPAKTAVAALGRQALHACLLQIEHPATGEIMNWQSGLPEDLVLLQSALRAAP